MKQSPSLESCRSSPWNTKSNAEPCQPGCNGFPIPPVPSQGFSQMIRQQRTKVFGRLLDHRVRVTTSQDVRADCGILPFAHKHIIIWIVPLKVSWVNLKPLLWRSWWRFECRPFMLDVSCPLNERSNECLGIAVDSCDDRWRDRLSEREVRDL